MKTITPVLLLSLCTLAGAAVNNGGFEKWEKNAPVRWVHTQQADAPASVLTMETKIVSQGKRSLYAEFYKHRNPKKGDVSYILANGSFTSVNAKKKYNVSVDYYALAPGSSPGDPSKKTALFVRVWQYNKTGKLVDTWRVSGGTPILTEFNKWKTLAFDFGADTQKPLNAKATKILISIGAKNWRSWVGYLDNVKVSNVALTSPSATLKKNETVTMTSPLQLVDKKFPKPAVVINVREYGAVGDGIADDAAAIQKAIDQVNQRGGQVFFPPGHYRITKTLRIDGQHPKRSGDPANWVDLVGVGSDASRLIGDGVDFIVSAVELHEKHPTRKNHFFKVNGLRVKGLTFTSYDTRDGKRASGIDCTNIIRWYCQSSTFIALETGIFSTDLRQDGKRTDYAQSVRILDNHFYRCYDYGIKIARVFDLTIENNLIEHGWGGIAVGMPGDGHDAAANTIRIENNIIEGIGKKPAILGSCWIGARIVGNYFEANYAGDIVLTPKDKDGWTRGLVIQSNGFQPTAAQRKTGTYGPIKLGKTMDALITGNFTTGAILIDHSSGPLGNDINIASNILNNPVAVGAAEGAKNTHAADYRGAAARGPDAEVWQVSSRTGTYGMHSARGFFHKPLGEPTRHLAYGDRKPDSKKLKYNEGDVILNSKPTVKDNRVLFGWTCVATGRPGTWVDLWISTQ